MTYWHWIGVAALAFIIEILTGTGFLLWIGLSSALVGLLLLLFQSISIGPQFIIFALLSLVTALLGRLYLHYHPIKTDKPLLNRRAEQYIGREFTLQAPVVNGMSKIHVDDSMWRVRCSENLPEGAQVRITGADGVILLIERSKIGARRDDEK